MDRETASAKYAVPQHERSLERKRYLWCPRNRFEIQIFRCIHLNINQKRFQCRSALATPLPQTTSPLSISLSSTCARSVKKKLKKKLVLSEVFGNAEQRAKEFVQLSLGNGASTRECARELHYLCKLMAPSSCRRQTPNCLVRKHCKNVYPLSHPRCLPLVPRTPTRPTHISRRGFWTNSYQLSLLMVLLHYLEWGKLLQTPLRSVYITIAFVSTGFYSPASLSVPSPHRNEQKPERNNYSAVYSGVPHTTQNKNSSIFTVSCGQTHINLSRLSRLSS